MLTMWLKYYFKRHVCKTSILYPTSVSPAAEPRGPVRPQWPHLCSKLTFSCASLLTLSTTAFHGCYVSMSSHLTALPAGLRHLKAPGSLACCDDIWGGPDSTGWTFFLSGPNLTASVDDGPHPYFPRLDFTEKWHRNPPFFNCIYSTLLFKNKTSGQKQEPTVQKTKILINIMGKCKSYFPFSKVYNTVLYHKWFLAATVYVKHSTFMCSNLLYRILLWVLTLLGHICLMFDL